MKFLCGSIILTFLSFISYSQSSYSSSQGGTVNYKITDQNAPHPSLVLNFDFVDLDFGVKNIDGASLNLGLRGYVLATDQIGIDYSFQKSWLTGNLSGSNVDFELGGHFLLSDNIKNKNTKIILDYDISKNYDGPRTTETISSTTIFIPAERRILRGVRGGLIGKSGPIGVNDIEGVISADANLNSTGIYAGVIQKSLINVFAEVTGRGIMYNSSGRDISFDVMYFPSQSFKIDDSEGIELTSDIIENELDGGSLGWRVVYTQYQIEKKTKTGKLFGMTQQYEFGVKPYQGFYFGASLGLTLIKMQKDPLF